MHCGLRPPLHLLLHVITAHVGGSALRSSGEVGRVEGDGRRGVDGWRVADARQCYLLRTGGTVFPAGSARLALPAIILCASRILNNGLLDLAISGFEQVTTLSGTSKGTLAQGPSYFVGAITGLAAADFDGDGKLDLAASGRGVTVLVNDTP